MVRIGDFDLAISLDRSRLTQEKMMVGTVSYMPPEQATGDEITPKADLYSLGAMLYEMVAGRPPFMGDDEIAHERPAHQHAPSSAAVASPRPPLDPRLPNNAIALQEPIRDPSQHQMSYQPLVLSKSARIGIMSLSKGSIRAARTVHQPQAH
jgi:serine/threonine protein kinase